MKERPWADPVTGCSPEFWGRSIGWVPVAILDELECIPKNYPGYNELVCLVKELLNAVIRYQDESGLWYQVVDKADQKGNWLETSCSCLFAAAIARAVRRGILDTSFVSFAMRAWKGVVDRLEYRGEDLILGGICVGTGVGNYEHYCRRSDQVKIICTEQARFLMCAELEICMQTLESK